jgi:membrane protein implicated in regulation of membrane protease activity
MVASRVREERPLIEEIADAVGVFQTVWITLVTLAITLALLIMGNTLARLIGLFFLSVLLVVWARRLRTREKA